MRKEYNQESPIKKETKSKEAEEKGDKNNKVRQAEATTKPKLSAARIDFDRVDKIEK